MTAVATQFLSRRASTLPASPIRALLASAVPSVLDLGGGIPDPELIPQAALTEAATRVLHTVGARALSYAPTEGLESLRGWIANHSRSRGLDVSPEQILVTHGSQQALSAVAALLSGPTQPAWLEMPVYPGALQAFSLAEAPLGSLPVTRDGWQLDALTQALPAVVYVNPHFQNPTGRSASPDQCAALAQLAIDRKFWILEDDAYGELGFDGRASTPLAAYAPERTILIGSFSKTLSPGLRLGFVVAPRRLIAPLVRVLQAMALQAGTFSQYWVAELLQVWDFDAHLKTLRSVTQARARALAADCESLGLIHEDPVGGYFLWTRTAGNATAVAQRARELGVSCVPESAFGLPGMGLPDRHLRLAFARYPGTAASRALLGRALGTPP